MNLIAIISDKIFTVPNSVMITSGDFKFPMLQRTREIMVQFSNFVRRFASHQAVKRPLNPITNKISVQTINNKIMSIYATDNFGWPYDRFDMSIWRERNLRTPNKFLDHKALRSTPVTRRPKKCPRYGNSRRIDPVSQNFAKIGTVFNRKKLITVEER
ncbi:MAG TPA: hypothetical protein PK677_07165 [Acidiphilium sp.]|nr:hypothetical protein [Acidiphilium sp.]HQU23371.1 hypothetical protein [Acidiphilium sp.]